MPQEIKSAFDCRVQPVTMGTLEIKCPRCGQVIARFGGLGFDFIVHDGMDIEGICKCGERVSAKQEAKRIDDAIEAAEATQPPEPPPAEGDNKETTS